MKMTISTALATGVVATLLIGASTGAMAAAKSGSAPLSGPASGKVSAAVNAKAAKALKALFADYEAFERAEDPLTSGSEGDKAALSKMPDSSPAADQRRLKAYQGFKARLDAINPHALTTDEAFNAAYLGRVLANAIEGIPYDSGRFAFNNEGGAGTSLAYIASSTRIGNLDEARAYVKRLSQFGAYMAQVKANAERGLKTGFVQPKSTVENALVVARNEMEIAPESEPLMAPFKTLPSTISEADQKALRSEARAIIDRDILPGRKAWFDFLSKDYLPKARPGLGVGSLPGGKAYYAYLAKSYTTTNLTPDQIHDLGQSEVARIRAQMQDIIKEVGFKGSFGEFLTFLRTDDQFYAKSREELMMRASYLAKQIDDKMPAFFGTLPRLSYGVRPVPKEIEETYTTGRYNGGSYKNGIAGGYIVNTGNLKARPLYELPALTLHEAVPGHHHQISLQQELGDQPWFRRNSDVTAFVEGWGLYSESLGYEMGVYKTPYERFGRLSYEMWRACRLVADTGIHWKGWSIDQARACFTDNSALSTHNIETELQRYIAWPGQALAYKVGELKIQSLKAKAKKELGPRFDIRRFHDAVLLGGPMPLDMLEQRIDTFIAQEKTRG